jgi:hypothetical protein
MSWTKNKLRMAVAHMRPKSFVGRLLRCGCVALFALGAFSQSFASIAYVQGTSKNPASGNPISATYASAQSAGDLNVVIVGWNDSTSTVTSITDTSGNSYVAAVGPVSISGTATQRIYYAANIKAAAAGANTVTVTYSASVVWPDVRIIEYSGISTSSPFDVGVSASGTGTAINSGAVTTTNANDLLVASDYVANVTSAADPTYVQRFLSAGGETVEDKTVTATGAYSAAATQNASGWWLMQLAAFRAATSNPVPVISTISPVSVSAGSSAITLTVNGSNFVAGATVNWNGSALSTTFVSAAQLTASVPAASLATAGTATVTAVNPTPGGGTSNTVNFTVTAAGDTQRPTPPTGLSATITSATQINLSWNASSDNVGVTGYRVERCLGASCSSFTQIATPTSASYSDTGVTSTSTNDYRYRVRATDAAGNLSLYSFPVYSLVTAGAVAYTYDELGRLKNAVYQDGAQTTYSLDAAGNRSSVVQGWGSGQLQFTLATYSVGEAAGSISIPVARLASSMGAISVHYATANGTATAGADYTATSGTLTWADGDTANKIISVPILNDAILEGNETFTVTLSAPTGGAVLATITQATVTIIDDDTVTFSIANVSVNERAGTATLTVTKAGTSALSNAVNYASANGTATAVKNYTAVSGTLTFASTDTTKTLTVPIIDDSIYTGNETFSVALSAPTNGATIGTGTATVTIVEGDTVSFSIASVSVNENAGSAVLTVTKTGASTVTQGVNYASANGTAIAGTDYTAVSGTLTFTAADITKTITVPITFIPVIDSNKTFSVALSAPTNGATLGSSSGVVTIIDSGSTPAVPALGTTPTGFTINQQFTVDWSASTGAAYYSLNESGAAANNYTITAPTRSWASGLKANNQFYYYKVKACTAANVCSAYSPLVGIETCQTTGCQ